MDSLETIFLCSLSPLLVIGDIFGNERRQVPSNISDNEKCIIPLNMYIIIRIGVICVVQCVYVRVCVLECAWVCVACMCSWASHCPVEGLLETTDLSALGLEVICNGGIPLARGIEFACVAQTYLFSIVNVQFAVVLTLLYTCVREKSCRSHWAKMGRNKCYLFAAFILGV